MVVNERDLQDLRVVALDMAVASKEMFANADEVVEAAEKYYAFLARRQ